MLKSFKQFLSITHPHKYKYHFVVITFELIYDLCFNKYLYIWPHHYYIKSLSYMNVPNRSSTPYQLPTYIVIHHILQSSTNINIVLPLFFQNCRRQRKERKEKERFVLSIYASGVYRVLKAITH